MDVFQVAIDGPVGAGKSTIARLTAARTGFTYIDTGAMYRAVALYALRNGADPAVCGEETVDAMLGGILISLETTGDGQKVFLNGEDVTGLIRGPEATRGSSAAAVYPSVRAMVTARAREIAADGNVIMDGRDIGTAVLPDAKLKVYLDAAVGIRAERRYKELVEKGGSPDFETLVNEIKQRDYNDTHRAADPLRRAEDAVDIDVGGMNAEEVVETILSLIKERGGC
ncbi:MAG: (d)CMP kinase [Defluviitaleaceae bacterium]|nr:(d)CMP kinase [Defluviitaleaceae bacterium]MCL2835672.1 (d)CMP kinase [Defluviitaleaceae bacterium]